jgi:type II restriction enzyme
MGKIEEAQEILRELELPLPQQNEISALTLLALCGLSEETPWANAQNGSLGVTKGIMAFIAKAYGRNYAPNTRETIRRQVLHQFIQARLVDYNPDIPDLPTNSPRTHYGITPHALKVIQAYGTPDWKERLSHFLEMHGSLQRKYQQEREMLMIPVVIDDGTEFQLSPGAHNELEVVIITEFAPRFAPGAKVLYVGDAANKHVHINRKAFSALKIPISEHDKMPDIIVLSEEKNWLFLIEAVTSHGPMTPKRVEELRLMFADCPAGLVYVSAFPNFTEFKKHAQDIAWETEVWIADFPSHLMHYNGDRFIGPR